MAIERIEIEKVGNYMKIGKDYYYPSDKRADQKKETIVFKKVNKKKIDKLIKEVTKKLKPALKSEDILKNMLHDIPASRLKRIHKLLFDKKKTVKPKIVQGCLELKIGNEVLDVRG